MFFGNHDLVDLADLAFHRGKYDSVSLRFWLEFLGVFMGDFVHIARTAGRSWENLGEGRGSRSHPAHTLCKAREAPSLHRRAALPRLGLSQGLLPDKFGF